MRTPALAGFLARLIGRSSKKYRLKFNGYEWIKLNKHRNIKSNGFEKYFI